jgi:hypothetical protein
MKLWKINRQANRNAFGFWHSDGSVKSIWHSFGTIGWRLRQAHLLVRKR